jgi:hypothetical protein
MVAAASLWLMIAAACAPATARQLTALCDGRNVTLPVTLIVDSVSNLSGQAVQRLAGRQSDIVLTLVQTGTSVRCENESGLATYSGELPEALRTATDPDRRLEWRIEGENVVVSFNPLVMDNNLGLALPLRGGPGRWSLSTLAGEIASGRVLPREE